MCWASICTHPTVSIVSTLSHAVVLFSDEQHILAVLKRELCPLARAMARAGHPVQRMSTAIRCWASVPSFSYIRRQRRQKVYIFHQPRETIPPSQSPISISFAVHTISLASALFPKIEDRIPTTLHLPTTHPNLTKLCPGGTTALKHHPHHLHLRPAQLTARNELSIPQPLLSANANGISARIIRPTDRASNTKAATGRSDSRTQQICRFPVTVIERPETHLFFLAKGKNRYGDGSDSLAWTGSARVSGNFFRLQSAKARVSEGYVMHVRKRTESFAHAL